MTEHYHDIIKNVATLIHEYSLLGQFNFNDIRMLTLFSLCLLNLIAPQKMYSYIPYLLQKESQ